MPTYTDETNDPWITPEDVAVEKGSINVSAGEKDSSILRTYARSACRWVEVQCGSVEFPRQFVIGDRVDVALDGAGGYEQRLPDGPINSISELLVDGSAVTVGTPRQYSLGEVDATFSGSILKCRNVIPRGRMNVIVSYNSAWSRASVPNDLKHLAAHIGALFFLDRTRAGLESEGAQGSTTSYTRELPEWLKATLEAYTPKVQR